MKNNIKVFFVLFFFIFSFLLLSGEECIGNVCKVNCNQKQKEITYLSFDYGVSTNFEFVGVEELKNPENYFEYYRFKYENDLLRTIEYYQQNKLKNGGIFGVAKIIIIYDSLNKELIFKDKDDNQIKTSDGVYRMKFFYQVFKDKKGKELKLVVKNINFDENGNQVRDYCGVAEYRFLYDSDGKCVEQQHFENGEIAEDQYGCAKIKWKYDNKGRLIEESFYDKNNSLKSANELFVPIKRWKYDDKGRMIEESYHDEKGNLKESFIVGYAKKGFVYNSKGQLEKIFYTDEEDMLVNNVYGYAIEIFQYKENGSVGVTKYLNKNGMEVFPKF
ncbi:MAG: hypothetical protein ABIN39_00325 [candidate division WOR-3 bacterium]